MTAIVSSLVATAVCGIASIPTQPPPPEVSSLGQLLAAARSHPLLVCHEVGYQFVDDRVFEWSVRFDDRELDRDYELRGGMDDLINIRRRRLQWGERAAAVLNDLTREYLLNRGDERVNPRTDVAVTVLGTIGRGVDGFMALMQGQVDAREFFRVYAAVTPFESRWRGDRLVDLRQPVERATWEDPSAAALVALRRLTITPEANGAAVEESIFRAESEARYDCADGLIRCRIQCTNMSAAAACLPMDIRQAVRIRQSDGDLLRLPHENGHDFEERENPSSRYLRVSPGRSVDLLLEIRLSALEHAGTMHDGAIELSLAALFHEFLIDGETGVVVPVRDVGR